jgi:putative effector of murein hydrolase
MMALAAYVTRGIQLALGTSKRAMTERAEELGHENDEIPMTAISRMTESSTARSSSELVTGNTSAETAEPQPQLPPRARDPPPTHQGPRETPDATEQSPVDLPNQMPVPPSRATKWAFTISSRLELVVYAVLFVFVGLPIYYTVGYAMPLQLTFSILVYFGAMSLSPNWRQYLHPVLVSSLFTVLGIWVLGLIKGHNLDTTLREFRTGATYLKLWDGSHQLPGAADIFSSVLDASIVSLALPMYQYRRELKQHFLAIVLPNVAISIGSLFAYPYICFAIGISAQRSLAFTARSLTLALATPAVANLGGDPNTVAALAIMSGILGVLIGQRMLALLKIPEGKYYLLTLSAHPSSLLPFLGASLLFFEKGIFTNASRGFSQMIMLRAE